MASDLKRLSAALVNFDSLPERAGLILDHSEAVDSVESEVDTMLEVVRGLRSRVECIAGDFKGVFERVYMSLVLCERAAQSQ